MEPQAFSPAGCLAFGDGFFYSLQHITYNFFIHTALCQLPLVLSIQFLTTALPRQRCCQELMSESLACSSPSLKA